jgi:hypothetical protein
MKEDIIRMAREAGFDVNFDIWAVSVDGVHINKELQRFAALVAAAVCESLAAEAEKNGNSILAMQLRARGQA